MLISEGMFISKLDPALFYWQYNGQCEGIVCVHMDDFLSTGTYNFEDKILQKLRDIFSIGSTDSVAFKYLGHRIQKYMSGISVDQFQYISTLKPVNISKQRATNKLSDLSEREKQEFRAAIGQLNWIFTSTRPDISYDVCELSVAFPRATVGDVLKLNKVIHRLTADNMRL